MKRMKKNKSSTAAEERQLLSALGTHFNGSSVLMLNGVAYKAKDLQKKIQAHVDAASAADALKSKWQTAVAAAQIEGATVAGILPVLRAYLISQFGGASQTVRDFGFTPKTRTTTVKAKADGIAKRAATRAAQGEAGQPEAIVGTVVPATAPEAPKPAATAVTSGSSANSATV